MWADMLDRQFEVSPDGKSLTITHLIESVREWMEKKFEGRLDVKEVEKM
jgi:hypothetical protein